MTLHTGSFASLALRYQGALERHIVRFAENALLEFHVAGDGLIDVAAHRTWRAGCSNADLDHLDLAVSRGMRAEEAAIGKAEADPAYGRLRAQQRQEQELPLDLVIGLDRSLEKDRADDLGGALGDRKRRASGPFARRQRSAG